MKVDAKVDCLEYWSAAKKVCPKVERWVVNLASSLAVLKAGLKAEMMADLKEHSMAAYLVG